MGNWREVVRLTEKVGIEYLSLIVILQHLNIHA